MEVKEAIEFLDKKNRYVLPKTNQEVEHNDEIDDIISLLQQGEKYRQMWEEFEEEYGEYVIRMNYENKPICMRMEYIKQKYFPKIN